MPDIYAPGDFDVAGFCVGVIELVPQLDSLSTVTLITLSVVLVLGMLRSFYQDLKRQARQEGLWNLFMPHATEWTPDPVSNLDYAHLAEITGRSMHLAPEALQDLRALVGAHLHAQDGGDPRVAQRDGRGGVIGRALVEHARHQRGAGKLVH
jgi:hypothetical protein